MHCTLNETILSESAFCAEKRVFNLRTAKVYMKCPNTATF